MSISSIKLIFFRLHIIPMTLYKDIDIIMPYFNKSMHVYGQNLSISGSPPNFTIANFGHTVSRSWLRSCCYDTNGLILMGYRVQH